MYRALIVDDEKMIRTGIRNLIPWSKLGIDQVALAACGAEALAEIGENRPDILLTDISMTGMSGLELIERIRQEDMDMRILVLTGYDSFEYAQQCLKMRVQDFLLKPTDEEQLAEAIRRQVEDLNQKRDMSKQQTVNSRVEGVRAQLELETAMRSLIHDRQAQEAEALTRAYGLDGAQGLQAALVVPVLSHELDRKDQNDFHLFSIKNLCIEMFDSKGEGITFEDENRRVVVAFVVDSGFDEVLDRVEQLNSRFKDELESVPKVVLGSVVGSLEELAISYNDALHLLGEVEQQRGEIFQSHGAEHRLKIFNEIFSEIKRVMCAGIGDSDRVMQAFGAFEKSIESYNLSNSYVRRCCFDMAATFYFSYVSQTDTELDNKLHSLLGSLISCGRQEACDFTRSFLSGLFNAEKQSSHDLVNQALQYIRDHLGEELSVSSIAEQLYVTPNYFSRLFKKAMGEGCNEYIGGRRVEKAKFLLETTNLKTGKIASMVGYRDANYFSLAFKKYTGMSPTTYRNSLRGIEKTEK